jgi:hypothetical protein
LFLVSPYQGFRCAPPLAIPGRPFGLRREGFLAYRIRALRNLEAMKEARLPG